MAFRLGEYVVYGELRNTHHYTTHGIVVLRGEAPGQETVVRLDLTGDCDRDLKGKCFRFMPGKGDPGNAVFRMDEHPGFQQRQIGPTGTMTAQGWVRTLPCPVEEFIRRAELGEAPPTPWTRRLYLEWYGQNGRTVVEMAGAVVEECVREPEDRNDEGEWKALPNLALPPDLTGERAASGPEITAIHLDGDEAHIETWTASESDCVEADAESLPVLLQRQLDADAAAVDRAIRGETEPSEEETIRELELMDHCIDHSEGETIASLLCGMERLRRPEELDDEQVEAELKLLLARLAMLGIALDVCEHFTPRDCYCLLLDEILYESTVYRELVGTGWVQHVMTHEYCADCDAEYDTS